MKFSINQIPSHEYTYFWRWFGHSKVIDNDNYPQIVFHGTKTKTPYHSLMQFGSSETENHRLRMMFSNDPDEVAFRHLHVDFKDHADSLKIKRNHPWGEYDEYDIYDKGSMIIPVFLHIDNPLVMSNDIAFFYRKIGSLNPEYAGILLEAGYTEKQIKKLTKHEHAEIVCELLLRHGFDGVKFPNIAEGNGDQSWIIIDPVQIFPLFDTRPKLSNSLNIY